MPSIREPSERAGGAPLLSLERLSVRYGAGAAERTVVRELSLTLAAGECLGVVGESGAGKSQAFLAVMGLLPPAARVSGSVHLEGLALRGLPRARLRELRGARIAMAFQDPSSALTPHLSIGTQLAETLRRHGRASWRSARERSLGLLERVHMSDAARRLRQFPHELSGGMRQRALLAVALACEPALLIADEPTTALDVTIQAQILGLLAELRRVRGTSIVLISHDLGVIAGLADRVAVMHQGALVELASAEQLFRAPVHAHTRALLAAASALAQPQAAAQALRSAVVASPPAEPALLELRAVSVRYRMRGVRRRALPVLHRVGLLLRAGGSLGIVGESGSGKSTLLRAILQLLPLSEGELRWEGRPVAQLTRAMRRALRAQMQMVFQDPAGSLDPRMTALELVEEPLLLHRHDLDAEARAGAARRMLAQVGLGEPEAARFAHELSGGQCQRIAIARAMVLGPRLLLGDEPVSSLDLTVREQILELIGRLRAQSGAALLLVSHDLAVVRQLCEQVLVLYLGRPMELASVEALFAEPRHPYSRALLAALPVPDPQRQRARLEQALPGEPPSAWDPPSGCVFRTRCPHAAAVCAEHVPPWEMIAPGHHVACHRWAELTRTEPPPARAASQVLD